MSEEKVIEIKFDKEKEKIFIFLRPNITLAIANEIIEIFKLQDEHKIYLLPSEYIESVKVIKDVKE